MRCYICDNILSDVHMEEETHRILPCNECKEIVFDLGREFYDPEDDLTFEEFQEYDDE